MALEQSQNKSLKTFDEKESRPNATVNVCQHLPHFTSLILVMVCATLFIPSILIDSYPASDDIPILAVILPATTREQHCSTECHPTTDTDWSSAATGNLQGPFAH